MPAKRSLAISCLFGLLLLVFLSACGGGNKTGAPPSGPVDPSSSYQGARTKATLTQSNSEQIVLNGFAGSRLGASLGGTRALKMKDASLEERDFRIRQLAKVMKQSVRSMQLPAEAKERLAARRQSGKAGAGHSLAAKRQVVEQVPGSQGGLATYNLELNDQTGSFYGTVTFQDYASDGVVMSGSADMMGTFDIAYQYLSQMTLSFRSLSVRFEGVTETIVGSISWASNYGATSESQTLNLVVAEQGKTYWWNNYVIGANYVSGTQTQRLSGRYYDHDFGYVDFSTESPVIVESTAAWPSQGTVEFTGDNSSKARLTFQQYDLEVGLDGNGDGSYEWHSDKPTNGKPAVNTPPLAAAGPDQSVALGAVVSLDGSGSSDADGDSLSYLWTFDSCPDNACPQISDRTSAKPSFTAEREGSYVLRLVVSDDKAWSVPDTVTVNSAVAAANPALLQMQWQYGAFGTNIGKAGLLTADLDGDGATEIVASASPSDSWTNQFWFVLRRGADGTYSQIWRSENYGTALLRLTFADLTGDGKDDIVAALTDGTIYVYDSSTLQLVRSLKLSTNMTAVAIADTDGDGKKEIVTSDGVGVFVYSAETGAPSWSLENCGGNSLAVGNVDGDAALEIVSTGYGGKGYVIDGVSRSVQWEYANGFGAQVLLGDLDGDGMQEIVGASAWYKITIFDAERKTPAWEASTDLDIDAVQLIDTDGDGIPEIVYGDRQIGGVHAIDVRTHAQRWHISNSDGGISGIAVGDVDGDGKRELLFGAGGSSSGGDYLYIADPATGAIKWRSQHVDGPLSAVAAGDLDGDGVDEVVMVSFRSDSGYNEGIVHIFDARTHALKFQKKLGIQDWMGVHTLRIGDVDGDGRNEYVVATGNVYDGVIQVYDGSTHVLKRQSAGYSGSFFSAMAIGDVDGDGKPEIVVGQGREHTGATGSYLIVLDGVTLQEKWRSVDLNMGWMSVYDIKLADIDGDGHVEIIASLAGQLTVYDGVNHDLKLLVDQPARALDVADIDGDGVRELLVGREDGKIDVLDGKTFALKKSVSTYSDSPIDALRVASIQQAGSRDLLVSSGGKLSLLDGQGQALVWRSSPLSGTPGGHNHLAVLDGDGDGLADIFVGGQLALYHFEVSKK